MKSKLRKELLLIGIVLLPFIYLGFLWKNLPDKVPIHWNLQGEIDRYGDKIELLSIPILLPLLTYLILLIIPKIDPKNKIKHMGNKYQSIKNILTVFMSILALFILYSTQNNSFSNPNLIILGVAILFIILGNYFKTIKPNYFIGIRTPWTLENEAVWEDTHILGGKMWFIGGILIAISSIVLNSKANLIVLLIITGILIIVPIVYSYFSFKKIKKKND
jgi:immunity protein, SdpI family